MQAEQEIRLPYSTESLAELTQEILSRISSIKLPSYKIDEQRAEKLKKFYSEPKFSLPQEYSSRSFENFKCYNNELKTAVNKLRAYKGGLCALLSPITGCGKTHLAIALARMHYRNLIYKWIDEKLESGEDFGDKNFAVNEFNKYSVLNEPLFLTEAEAFRMVYGNVEFTFWIKTTRLVIIDDVFSSRVNENTRSAVYELINTRVTNYRLDTVITSNLYINEIADIDPRIASRIQGDFTFELRNAVDYRGR